MKNAANSKGKIRRGWKHLHLFESKKAVCFGSVISNKFPEKSDIDLLISFSDTLTVEEYTDNYFALHYKLKELFHRKIDIVTERTLSNPYFIENLNETKKLIYET